MPSKSNKICIFLVFFFFINLCGYAQKKFIKQLVSLQWQVSTIDPRDSLEPMYRDADAFYYNYDVNYYLRKELVFSTSGNTNTASNYYNCELAYYKVVNCNLKIQNQCALDKMAFFSTLLNGNEEIVALKVTTIKPYGRIFVTSDKQIREITLGLYEDEDYRQFLINRLPASNLETGDVVNYFVITRSSFKYPQQTLVINQDYPIKQSTVRFYIHPSFGWQVKTSNMDVKGENTYDSEYSGWHYFITDVPALGDHPYTDISNAYSIILTFNSLTETQGWMDHKVEILPATYVDFCHGMIGFIGKQIISDYGKKKEFDAMIDSILVANNPVNLLDTLNAVQDFLNNNFSIIDNKFFKKDTAIQSQFKQGAISQDRIVEMCGAILLHLHVNVYWCYCVPRQCGKVKKEFFYLSPYHQLFIAVRKNVFEWYYLYPASGNNKYAVDHLPYYLEKSGFVAIRLDNSRRNSADWCIDKTKNLSASQNTVHTDILLEIFLGLDSAYIHCKWTFSGQNGFYREGLPSFHQETGREMERDSLDFMSAVFYNYGVTPDSLVIDQSVKTNIDAYKTYSIAAAIPTGIYPVTDSLYSIPLSKIIKYDALLPYDTSSSFNLDLGFPFTERYEAELIFPWNIQLINAVQYPLINSTELGKVKLAVLQSEENRLRILGEVTVEQYLIPNDQCNMISDFNDMLYKIMSHSIIISRK
jgi:hypothetical protein